jgi:hypothetical protein
VSSTYPAPPKHSSASEATATACFPVVSFARGVMERRSTRSSAVASPASARPVSATTRKASRNAPSRSASIPASVSWCSGLSASRAPNAARRLA